MLSTAPSFLSAAEVLENRCGGHKSLRHVRKQLDELFPQPATKTKRRGRPVQGTAVRQVAPVPRGCGRLLYRRAAGGGRGVGALRGGTGWAPGAGQGRRSPLEAAGAQDSESPPLLPLREGACCPAEVPPLPSCCSRWAVLSVLLGKRGAERERVVKDAVAACRLPVGAGAVQPGHGKVPVSLLRVLRLG